MAKKLKVLDLFSGYTLREDGKGKKNLLHRLLANRVYHAEGETFSSSEEAASRFGLNRQSFYNRANSENFPTWKIEVRREGK